MRCAVSLVIPAYNEAERLGSTLERAVGYLSRRGAPYEVLVVDDGSRDRTVEVAEGFSDRGVRVIRHERNRGKGAAVRTGVLASQGDEVLLSDADASTPIEELEKLERSLSEAPVVFGSRAVDGADVRQHQPFYRELMGKTFNRIIRLLGVRGVSDTQCGFKLMAGDVARELGAKLTIDGFAYDVELVWLARRRGYPIAEVGVIWVNSPDSRVDPVRSSLSMLRDVIRMRVRHSGGR
ncbi:MAG TPA: dolichyl-phosphate beta-glucosyltransferase [Thermoanaerobaculia bacterium]|jgi:dolichyl-phosphate beta-glucosyltransferase|nr:dolichyl-phosphate beta-glucosyltransferase [Thermoanaerobaculia bacterium]